MTSLRSHVVNMLFGCKVNTPYTLQQIQTPTSLRNGCQEIGKVVPKSIHLRSTNFEKAGLRQC